MIGNEDLITKINTIINAGNLSDLQLIQLSGAVESIKDKGISSVATFIELPSASANRGRFFYIPDEGRYVFSNGVEWNISNILKTPLGGPWAWGNNASGRLGDNTILNRSSPVSAVGGFTDWVQITAGNQHTAAIRANGTAWAWGGGTSGQLGDNTTLNKSSPVSVVGGYTDWVQVAAGGYHTAAIRANGTAWSWGRNQGGPLGDNTTTNQSSPVSVVGGFTDWVQVSAFSDRTAAIRANGTAWGWGTNSYGRLGDNTNTNRSSPVSVVGGFTDWVQITAGNQHTAALRANGTVWAWGSNGNGRLGDNTVLNRSSPVSVVGGFTDWVQITAGNQHTAALRANGTAWGWGSNGNGQLGDNTTISKSSPVSVVGGYTDWVQVAAGGYHTAALRANGTAWAWGNAGYGRLGDNTTISKSSPVSVVGGFTDWVQISAGNRHTTALRTN